MSPLRFIRTSEINAFTPIQWRGRRVLEAFESLRAFLDAKSNGRLGGLLAAPALASESSAAARSIAWYTTVEGEIVPLVRAHPDHQQEALRGLREALHPAAEWLTDPNTGLLLQRALIVATIEDILLVGNQVILINWGLAPPSAADSEAGLRQHFEATLGRYVTLPWPSTPVHPLPQASPRNDPLPPPVPERSSQKPAPPAVIAEVTSVAPAPAASWRENTWAYTVTGGALLLCGLLLGLLIRFMEARPPDSPVANDLLHLQNEVNRSLEKQVDRLRKALAGDVCAVEAPRPLLPFPAQSPVQPAQGDPAPTPAPGAAPTPTLAQRLEETTVLVLSPQADGLSMGTGFLVAPGVILSNSHVVGTPAPNSSIFVTGKALGGLQKAQLLNATPLSETRERLNTPDFALLKITTGTASFALPLTALVEKLEPVVAAGFPGFELQVDPKFAALLDKNEMSAIPELVMSSGEISVVRGEGAAPTIIAHTAIVSQGNSGGPLVDRCGRVVGINTLIRLDDESRRQGNYALGGDALLAYLRQHQIPVTVANHPCKAKTTP